MPIEVTVFADIESQSLTVAEVVGIAEALFGNLEQGDSMEVSFGALFYKGINREGNLDVLVLDS